MKFEELLNIVGGLPVFESSLLWAGDNDPKLISLQLTRWVNTGRILKLRRGLYTLAEPYVKVYPHPFLMANYLLKPSYVSGFSALAYYGLIPEITFSVTSVTASRTIIFCTPFGNFNFHHIQKKLFTGYQKNRGGQSACLHSKT